MDLQLKGKRALITGASKGIGYASALSFAREGALPILVARNAEGLAKAAASIKADTGVTVETIALDLGAADGVQLLAQRAGDVDILINNAGAIPGGNLAAVDDARWRAGWELKLYGYINLAREYLPRMEARGQGVIVNIIGMAGVANRYAYVCGSTANAALIAFTNSVGSMSPEHGVRMFGINPSQTRTDRIVQLTDPAVLEKMSAGLPFGRLMEPAEVANLAVFGCSPLAGYLSGTVINLDGGQMYR